MPTTVEFNRRNLCLSLGWASLGAGLTGTPVAAGQTVVPHEIGRFVSGAARRRLPFELAEGVMLVRVAVNGVPCLAMLDIGVEGTLLDTAFQQAHVKGMLEPAGDLTTPTGALPRRRVASVALDIPGQMSIRLPMFVGSLAAIRATTGRPVQLIIGMEFFRAFGMVAHFEKMNVDFGPPCGLTPSQPTPMADFIDLRPSVAVTINGKAAKLYVDLGFSGEVMLSTSRFREFVAARRPVSERIRVGLDGVPFKVQVSGGNRLRLAEYDFSEVSVEGGNTIKMDDDGFLGLGLLGRTNILLDIACRKMWIGGSI